MLIDYVADAGTGDPMRVARRARAGRVGGYPRAARALAGLLGERRPPYPRTPSHRHLQTKRWAEMTGLTRNGRDVGRLEKLGWSKRPGRKSPPYSFATAYG